LGFGNTLETNEKSRFTESQIAAILKEADAGMKVADVCCLEKVAPPGTARLQAQRGDCAPWTMGLLEMFSLDASTRRTMESQGCASGVPTDALESFP